MSPGMARAMIQAQQPTFRDPLMKRSDTHRALHTLRKSGELALAAPHVVALRSARLGAAAWPPGPSDQREFVRMGTEKVQAFSQSAMAMWMQMAALQQRWAMQASAQWWSAWAGMWMPWLATKPLRADPIPLQRAMLRVVYSGISPIHRTARANSRRLGKRSSR